MAQLEVHPAMGSPRVGQEFGAAELHTWRLGFPAAPVVRRAGILARDPASEPPHAPGAQLASRRRLRPHFGAPYDYPKGLTPSQMVLLRSRKHGTNRGRTCQLLCKLFARAPERALPATATATKERS